MSAWAACRIKCEQQTWQKVRDKGSMAKGPMENLCAKIELVLPSLSAIGNHRFCSISPTVGFSAGVSQPPSP